MKLKRIFFLLLFSTGILIGNAQDGAKRFEQANAAYLDGDFKEAENLYIALINEGFESPELYYNFGNTNFRLNKIPESILYYEKALKLSPRNKDYQYNLSIAMEKIVNPLEEVPEFFLDNWWRSMSNFFSATTWSIIAMSLLWIGITGIIIWLIGKTRSGRKMGFLLGVTALLLCILPFLLAGSRAKMVNKSHFGIVMKNDASLKSAPESDQVVLDVPTGTKVVFLDKIGDWKKVQLPNGESGWMSEKMIENI